MLSSFSSSERLESSTEDDIGVFSVIARIDLSIGVLLIFLSFCTIPAEEDLMASMRLIATRTKGVKENLYPPLAGGST